MTEPEFIELNDKAIIEFNSMTKEYGRAEFSFCLKWKRGKLTDVWISPFQQPHSKSEYHIGGLKCGGFRTYAWTYEGMENPWPWTYGWCNIHKCQFMRVYVPPHSSKLCIEVLSTLSLIFE